MGKRNWGDSRRRETVQIVRTGLGAARVTNKSTDFADRRLFLQFQPLATLVAQKQLELSHFLQRTLNDDDVATWMPDLKMFVDEIGSQVGEGEFDSQVLCKSFVHEVADPIRRLMQLVERLREERTADQACQTREFIKSSAGRDQPYFEKMLTAFDVKIRALINLVQGDERVRKDAADAIREANALVARAELALQSITDVEKQIVSLLKSEDKGTSLDDLVKAVDALQRSKASYAVYSKEWEGFAEIFYLEQGKLGRFIAEWNRMMMEIRHASDLFLAAELDPFDLSDEIRASGKTWDELKVIPAEEERNELEGSSPREFPRYSETKTGERANGLIRKLREQQSKSSIVPAEHRPLQSQQAPLSPLDLAVCTYAAFVEKTASGACMKGRGKTPLRVWNDMLVPGCFTMGLTFREFESAALNAVSDGLLQSAGSQSSTCLQPTVKGLSYAREHFTELPPSFEGTIQRLYQALLIMGKKGEYGKRKK